MAVRDQELIKTVQDVQLHWQENGIFQGFTIEEAQRFHKWIVQRESELKRKNVIVGDTMHWV
jgi:hypothetical protein